jgi:hypothetical protein
MMMMGERQVDQAALFYEFSLDRHAPQDHLLRSIDRFVEPPHLLHRRGDLHVERLDARRQPADLVGHLRQRSGRVLFFRRLG